MASTKDYTLLAVVLMLSLCAGSGRGLVGEGEPEEGTIYIVSVVSDPAAAEERNGAQKPKVNGATGPPSSSSHPAAASGLGELVQRRILLSHALNRSKDAPIDGDEEERVREGLADLVRKMTLFSLSLNTSRSEPLNGKSSGGEQRVSEGLADLVKRMVLFSHALNMSMDEPKGVNGEKVKEGLTDLVDRMILFSYDLNMPSAVAEDADVDQRTKGLADLVDRMILFSYALNRSSNGSTEGGGDGGQERVSEGLNDLVDRIILFSYALNRSTNGSTEGGGDGEEERAREGLGELVQRMLLFSHALKMSNHEHKIDGGGGGEKQRVDEGLAELGEALTGDHMQLLGPPADTPDIEHREQPCLPPFEMIAYRMCILQEMVLKLSWGDAQEFCRERGGMLAEDMVVIKTRRFLNDLYGEEGARSRWPVWVGGRRAGQTWVWGGGQRVPEFLWAPGEPRKFSSHLSPEGQCMMLDGYRRFYGASLPCYLRRRFVCQLNV
ncbi:uncharacterized protein LOC127008203 isoform X1 [Eriocheir sinensis]|uniref:uncharacterized protein LOC127008203 isoform X1 n=1 Tax=Eriocheir sinensis TaxID=95602 RepID=UPI0021C651AF|nr:uncharacterized protein LOC127008203 isoform X1 [Eriocheir sinensis]